MTTPRSGTVAMLVAPVVIIAVLLGGIILVSGATPPACNTAIGANSPAVRVDPSSVPDQVGPYTREQLTNAAYIMTAAQQLGLSSRDQQIGIMTAIGESSLRVLDRGDRAGPDSRGLFQQRDNGAWGSLADRMNPLISSTNFFRAMMQVPGRESLEPTLIAHKTQRNRDPWHYERYWDDAGRILQALAGVTAAPPQPTPPAGEGGSYTYQFDSRTKPEAQALANTVGPMFGVQTIGGYRASARDPKGHPSGLALDLMVPLTPEGRAQGDRIARYLEENHEALGVEYIIWYQRYWNPRRGTWSLMGDRGSPTQNHFDHVHVNVKPGAQITNPGATGAVPGCQPAGTTSSGAVSTGGWAAPSGAAPSTSSYGWRIHPVHGGRRFHYGTDFGAACDSPIYAAGSGIVIRSGPAGGYGNLIEIDHGSGTVTRYAHMYSNGLLARVGDQVSSGQQIAKVGSAGVSTGCHLHFEVRINGNAVDPYQYLVQRGVSFQRG